MKPNNVRSPKEHWQLIDVLFDGGPDGFSLALGEWDHERVLAIRWNGAEGELGSPQSRGLPIWFILPDVLRAAVLTLVPPEKRALAEALLTTRSAA